MTASLSSFCSTNGYPREAPSTPPRPPRPSPPPDMPPDRSHPQPPPAVAAHVLHVDDDAVAARTLHQMLVRLGYRVTSCACPREALEHFHAAPAAFDLVLTDLLMPVLDGAELARQILALRPEIPVIVVSGFLDRWSTERLLALGIRELIAKPVDFPALAATLRQSLDRSSPNS